MGAGFLTKGQKSLISYKVDPSIVGGMIVSIGDKYVDMSIASKLKKYSELIKSAAETECSDGWSKVCHTTYKNDCKETIENSCWKEFGPECTETPSQQCVTSKEPTETEVCEDEDVKECGRDGHNCKDVKKPVCRMVKKYSSKTTCYDIMIHNCQEVGREVCKSSPEQKCTLVPDGQDCKDEPGVGEWGKKIEDISFFWQISLLLFLFVIYQ